MSNARLETFIWVLLYGGLLVLCLGLFVLRADAALGGTLLAAGGAATAGGLVGVWWRSRRGP